MIESPTDISVSAVILVVGTDKRSISYQLEPLFDMKLYMNKKKSQAWARTDL